MNTFTCADIHVVCCAWLYICIQANCISAFPEVNFVVSSSKHFASAQALTACLHKRIFQQHTWHSDPVLFYSWHFWQTNQPFTFWAPCGMHVCAEMDVDLLTHARSHWLHFAPWVQISSWQCFIKFTFKGWIKLWLILIMWSLEHATVT